MTFAPQAASPTDNFYRAVRQATNEAMVLIDPDSESIVEVNGPARDLLGYSLEELLGMPVATVHPGEMKLIRQYWSRIASGDIIRTDQLSCTTQSRGVVPADIAFSLVESNARPLILANIRDASRSPRLRDFLYNLSKGTSGATGAEFFRRLVRHAAKAFDAELSLVSEWTGPERTHFRTLALWNDGGFQENAVYSTENIPCRLVLEGHPQYFPDAVNDEFPLAPKVGGYLGVPLVTPNGEVLGHLIVADDGPLLDSSFGLPALEILASRASAELIRARTENALRDSEAAYRLLYAKTPVMLHSVDHNGLLEYVSDEWLAILGRERHEVIGRSSSDFLTDESRHYAVGTCLPRFFEEGQMKDEPLRFLAKDGTEIDVLMSAVAERNEAGEVVRSLAVSIDVTERRKLEAAILEISDREHRRLGQDLHDELGQTLNGLWFMADRIAERMEQAGHALAGSVRTMASLLGRAMAQVRSLVRGLNMTDLRSEDLVPALEDLASNVEEAYSALPVRCVVRSEGVLPLAGPRSPKHIYRIVQESVTNAIKHGGADRLDICLRSQEGVAEVTIRDNGSGMPKGGPGGDGFGLSIMKYRAGLMGARLSHETTEEGGTLVRCRIPSPPD